MIGGISTCVSTCATAIIARKPNEMAHHQLKIYPFCNRMSTSTSNLSLSNGVVYQVSTGQPFGYFQLNQPTTGSFVLNYNPYITSNYNHNYSIIVADSKSNITATLQNSNLIITNQSSNLFSTVITPYLLSNSFNTVNVNRYDKSLQVAVNNTPIVRITSSNELPISYDNSTVKVQASNGGSFSNSVIYQPISTVETPMQFNKPVKFVSTISASNVSSCNLTDLSNATYWSSNNLLNKTGGTMTGRLGLGTSNPTYMLDSASNCRLNNAVIGDPGLGGNFAVFSHSNAFSTTGYGMLSTNLGRTILNCQTGQTMNFRIGNTDQGLWNATGLGIKTTTPAYELDIVGDLRLMKGATSNTTIYLNSTNLANTTSIIQFVNNGHYIACTDSNWGGMGKVGTGHNQYFMSGGHIFGGSVQFNSNIGGTAVSNLSNVAMYGSNVAVYSSNTVIALSNLTAPKVVFNSNTAISASNTATWASNNNINRLNETINNLSNVILYTNQILMPSSANILGSGWTYNAGWQALGSLGGYIIRNNGAGGVEFYTGLSNALQMSATITSNGNMGLGTYSPTDKLTISGNLRVLGDGNPGGIVLSNNNSPGIQLQMSNASMEMGMACFNGAYSYDAVIGDFILRSSSNVILQTGAGSACMCINSNNNVGIKTKTPLYGLHVASSFFASNITSPTLDNLSNVVYPTNYSANFSSNTSVYSSNTARWSSNYGATLCNFTTDAYNKATWGSNNFNNWLGTTSYAMPDNSAYIYNRNVNLPFESYALMQYSNGLTEINGSRSNGVIICDHGAIIASFSNNTMEMNGGDIYTYGLRAWQETTLKRGSNATPGTYTHFPYWGDQKNYIRGTTVMADTEEAEMVGIGTTAPAYKLEVSGATRLSSLIVGSHTDEMKSIRNYSVYLPSSSTRTCQIDATGTFPSLCSVYATVRATGNYNDVFACSVIAISTSNIRFSVARADSSGGWSQTGLIDFMVVGL